MAQELRKLAAIVSADIVGYSRLMGADEVGTHLEMKAIRSDIVEPGIKKARGRLVSTAGDSFLIEFGSGVVAVGFAMELQALMAARNAKRPSNQKFEFRIGINIGDIIVDGDDIQGSGVNIAARLQTIAAPGGICIAQSVYDFVRSSLSGAFTDGGERELKNILHSVRVWHWSEATIAKPVPSPNNIPDGLIPPPKHSRNQTRRNRPIPDVRELISRHKSELLAAAQANPFIVFLCGPTLNDTTRPSANLRSRLKAALEAEKFEVVLGEDDGLEDGRLALGVNAQDNELEFISTSCNAVIVIADSVGAFCELGLFSWHFVHEQGLLSQTRRRTEFILLVGKQFEGVKSYFNEGPARAVNAFGTVFFIDFATYDFAPLLTRIRDRRGIITVDNKRGRPRKARV